MIVGLTKLLSTVSIACFFAYQFDLFIFKDYTVQPSTTQYPGQK